MSKKGITLIAVILLMTLLAITVVGLTAFVIERLRFTIIRQNEINAYYMAQAGIHYGIYQYRVSKGETTSGIYDVYGDRGFSWEVTSVTGNIITIQSTGYSPKTVNGRIEKILQARYNENNGKLTGLGYGS